MVVRLTLTLNSPNDNIIQRVFFSISINYCVVDNVFGRDPHSNEFDQSDGLDLDFTFIKIHFSIYLVKILMNDVSILNLKKKLSQIQNSH
jgi:hypothetical protein